jgi:hypothetical protein
MTASGQSGAFVYHRSIGSSASTAALRDVMTAILIRFEWHDDVRSQKRAHPPTPSTPRRQTTDPCNQAEVRVKNSANSRATVILQLLISMLQIFARGCWQFRKTKSFAAFRREPSAACRRARARGLAGLDVIAVDANTVSPPHDLENMSAFLAAQVISEGLALLCQKPS